MPDLNNIRDGLALVQKAATSVADDCAKAAAAELKARDAAIKAAQKAGLVVDESQLPEMNAGYAAQRFTTLQALLIDAQSQVGQIESLLA